jgi:ankyrin repeat protein
MTKVTPRLVVDLIGTFPPEEREEARRDLAGLISPPHPDLSCRIQSRRLPVPVGLLEYALRFGSVASAQLLLEAGLDPNDGTPRLLTQLTMAPFCRDDGRIEKLEALIAAKAEADYIERGERNPATPMIALARSKLRGIQRYWIARLLRTAGAPPIANNDYELHVMGRLLAETRAIDAIMDCLPADAREATMTPPGGYAGLVSAVLRSEDPVALGRMLTARQELKLPLDFDATSVLIELSARLAGQRVSLVHADFIRLLLEAGAEPTAVSTAQHNAIAPLLAQSRVIDDVVAALPPAEQASIRSSTATPSDLLEAVLRSEEVAALKGMIVAREQGALTVDFDPTAGLVRLAGRIADHPVSPKQADFVRALLRAGAEMQAAPGESSAFELAVHFENHELVDIFIEAGAKPDLASAPEMVCELMRRQGLPQLPKPRSGSAFSRFVWRSEPADGLTTCG